MIQFQQSDLISRDFLDGLVNRRQTCARSMGSRLHQTPQCHSRGRGKVVKGQPHLVELSQ